jgi:2-polyprenyl-3-methyl-5-hydroxy-6-metoxy-1,4-benzoquinol methylase
MKIRKLLKQHVSYDTRQILDQKAWDYLQNCESIIDIGCGDGRFISIAPEKISGIDSNSEAVKYCRTMGYNVTEEDALQLNCKDQSYDGVHCSHMIEHLYPEEAWELINTMDRILKPGGIMCLQAPLMSPHFYNDLSHIRPYPPQAILEYLDGEWDNRHPLSFGVIKGNYITSKIYYRNLPIFSGKIKNPFIKRILEVLARIGIRSAQASGFLLILKKLET